MLTRRLLTLAILFSACLVSRADTISTFNLSGSAVTYGLAGDFNTVSGTITIDTTTGVAQAIALTAGGIFLTGVDSQAGPIVYFGNPQATASFDAGSLIGYNGSNFDLSTSNDKYVGQANPAPAAVAPEPSSFLLLGTGLLSVAGMMRRWRTSEQHSQGVSNA